MNDQRAFYTAYYLARQAYLAGIGAQSFLWMGRRYAVAVREAVNTDMLAILDRLDSVGDSHGEKR